MEIYRGYTITQEYDLNYYAIDGEDYDADYVDGEFVQCAGMPCHSGATADEVKAEIDNYYAELEE